ncbi:unnamed protein product [Paramecium pentaurelia]|uniref:MORN repeat protein n=1 Tax=Paramecium pentaurelia TaxID=43138 RepID=A0A8S1TKA0_9CILI|nr:unnamed protein product [Paramecium pentaurelia]
MLSSHINCDLHPQYGLVSICTAKHQCQRKLCPQCVQEHKIASDLIIPYQKFVEQLLQKFDKSQIDFQSQQSTTLLQTIQKKLDSILEEVKIIITNLKESINIISTMSKYGDNRYENLINPNLNPLECKVEDLQFLVEFLNSNSVMEWNKKKKIVLDQMTKVIPFWEKLVIGACSLNHAIDYVKNYLQIYYVTSSTQKEITQEIICLDGLEQTNYGLSSTKFYFTRKPNGNKIYSKEGDCLRLENTQLGQQVEDIIHNLEQIRYLQFKGQFGINGYKIKQWNYFWKEQQIGGGKFNFQGQKEGKWIDLCQDYCEYFIITISYQSQKNVIEIGSYQLDKRIGCWNYFWKNNKIGGGLYDEIGNEFKTGLWIELSNGFRNNSQVTYNGEYNNGQKVGSWDIFYNYEGKNKKIGGGSYDQINQMKIGRWIELSDEFYNQSQVTYHGVYVNDKKVGRWDIFFKGEYEEEFKKIGGGSYDEDGDELKIGKWTELSRGFNFYSQVTYNGDYKNGKKVGLWDIYFNWNGNQKIGGGQYAEEGNEFKVGKWTELSDGFKDDSQVTYKGEYLNGKKVCKWDAYFKNIYDVSKYEWIGGGLYDEEGNGLKIGEWIELSDEFEHRSQVTYNGQYKLDKKVGEWVIYFNLGGKQQIGGGSYDEVDSIKKGKWIELREKFYDGSQVTYDGEYKKGKKVGKWDILYKGRKIGGGFYDNEDSFKIGKWIELSGLFAFNFQVTHIGDYKIGKKIGKWDIYCNNEKIGGGFYDQEDSVKIGKWIDLSDGFSNESQVTYVGEYKKGNKVGKWNIQFKNEKVGGGLYGEENSIKIGKWIEVIDNFGAGVGQLKITYNGEYNDGKKVGTWIEMDIGGNKKRKEISYNN